MNIAEAIQRAIHVLNSSALSKSAHSSESDLKLDAHILLAHATQLDLGTLKTKLIAHPELTISEDQEQCFFEFIDKRAQLFPTAYITGHQAFWSLELLVNEHVLIPRPETECLVEFILQHFSKHLDTPLQGVDLGTGSGAIPFALSSEAPAWKILAVDKSEAALQCARDNQTLLSLPNVNFIQSDWFNQVPKKQFDFIVCNPPYVEENAPELQDESIQFEPISALTSGNGGLSDISVICEQATHFLKAQAPLIIEHGYQQGAAVAEIFKQSGFEQVECFKDLAKLDRFTVGFKPHG